VLDKRSECLLCFSDVDLSNSSNLCISSLRLINGFFSASLWFSDSEIIGELNRINAVLQDFITDIEQNLRRTEQEQSVILAREKYEVDKVTSHFLSLTWDSSAT
jgi:hypothetical protein